MHTLNANYQRNIEILKLNLKRGLTVEQAQNTINGMHKQFVSAGLYDDEARAFIHAMRGVLVEHFTKIEVVLV